MNVEEWTEVLRLSSKWSFNEIRANAIKKLDDSTLEGAALSTFSRLHLANECQVAAWLLQSYRDLVTRSDGISVEDAEELGDWRKAILLCGIREQRIAMESITPSYWDPSSQIESVFLGELHQMQEIEKAKYSTKADKEAMRLQVEAEELRKKQEREEKEKQRIIGIEEERKAKALAEYEAQLAEQSRKLKAIEEERIYITREKLSRPNTPSLHLLSAEPPCPPISWNSGSPTSGTPVASTSALPSTLQGLHVAEVAEAASYYRSESQSVPVVTKNKKKAKRCSSAELYER